MSEYSEIRYEVTDRIATITLDRPQRRNAFTEVMCRELVDAFAAADADDGVRVAIVTGSGSAFCAGADLEQGADTFTGRGNETIDGVPRDGGGIVALRIAAMRKPVIAAINGPAVGVGVTMTLPMDIRLAAETARFGFVFTRRGLVCESASSWFLPRLVGIAQAMEWVATGRVFDAEQARAGGLVSRVLPDHELLDAARALGAEIAENTSPVAVAASRQLLWGMLGASSPWPAHLAESKAIFDLGARPDVAEGVTSFLEKRPPRFPMRLSDDYPDYIPPWPRNLAGPS